MSGLLYVVGMTRRWRGRRFTVHAKCCESTSAARQALAPVEVVVAPFLQRAHHTGELLTPRRQPVVVAIAADDVVANQLLELECKRLGENALDGRQ